MCRFINNLVTSILVIVCTLLISITVRNLFATIYLISVAITFVGSLFLFEEEDNMVSVYRIFNVICVLGIGISSFLLVVK